MMATMATMAMEICPLDGEHQFLTYDFFFRKQLLQAACSEW
jgi:hypothetical protein